MAQYYAVNATNVENSAPAVKVPVGEGGGELVVYFDSFVLPNPAMSANDLIDFCAAIPPNSRLIDVHYVFPAWANSATVSLGWKANDIDPASASGITSALSVTSAGQYRMTTTDPTNAYKKFNVGSTAPQKTTQLQAKVGTAPSNTSGTNYWAVTIMAA